MKQLKLFTALFCMLLCIGLFAQESTDPYGTSTTTESDPYGTSSTDAYTTPTTTTTSSIASDNPRRFGAGYDEGLAARFFFTQRMGVQAGIHVEYLGGYSETTNNGGALHPETNVGFGAGFLFNLFSHEKLYVDALGQLLIFHDDARDRDDVGDRTYGIFRAALCPELMIFEQLGLGFKLGLEVVYRSESKQRVALAAGGQAIIDTDDATTDVRFFGPSNPFYDAVLGVSLYYYFDM